MEDKVTADLVERYFAGNCTTEEEAFVGDWLQANPANTMLAMQWQEELSDEDEQLFIEVLRSEKDIWKKTIENTHKNSGTIKGMFLSEGEKTAINQCTRIKNYWLKAAAVLSGIILLAFAVQLHWNNRLITVQTAYGQIRSIVLPDQSVVRLNGNSKLTYKACWQGKSREVWLVGEAFFDVTHLENHQKFLVHLSDQKDIEVLGTEFNVSDRTTGSFIVLKSGKIKFNLQEHTGRKSNNIFLEPGDLVEVPAGENKKGKIKKSVVNPQMYYAWTSGKWLLNGTSLGEMLQRLEETYGVRTVVRNKALLKRQASGSIPLPEGNAEALITDIANLFELKIHKQDNHIYLDSIQ